MFRGCIFWCACFLTFAANAQYEQHVVAKYTFDKGTIVNEASGVQPKSLGVSIVEDRFGNDNAAIYLQGNRWSYLNLGADSILKPVCGSISLWLNIDIVVEKGDEGWDYNPVLLTKSRTGNDFYEGYFIGLNFHTYRLNVTTTRDQLHQISLNSRKSFGLRQWHHVVMTYDDNYLTLYLDNERQASQPKNFRSVFLAGDSVMIGNSANQKNERFLCGTVDDLVIYDTVIDEHEIDRLFHAPDPNRANVIIKWTARVLIALSVFAVLVWLVFRKLRRDFEREKEKSRVEAHLNELETKAIRSQMNPHFIFNALSTLQRFILEENMDKANRYLVKFSKLLRELLESSASESVSLKEEMDILNGYIEIERLRFDQSFDFSIEMQVDQPENVHIPFMLIQPFVENAIWHGLMPKQGKRVLRISVRRKAARSLVCEVDDNGVGREAGNHPRNPMKKRSVGMDFVKQRLEILQKVTGIDCYFEVVDKKNADCSSAGTLVQIVLPVLSKTEAAPAG